MEMKVVGAVEAKAEGALAGVEAQTAKYAVGLPDDLSVPHLIVLSTRGWGNFR